MSEDEQAVAMTPDELAEFVAWEQASDEALQNFEESLEGGEDG